MRVSHAVLAVVLVLCLLPAVAQTLGTGLATTDRAWMQSVLARWQQVASEDLRLPDEAPPWVVFFGPEWVWHVNPDPVALAALEPRSTDGSGPVRTRMVVDGRELPVTGFPHGGTIHLPEGGEIPPELILFAATYGEREDPYFVMAMPAIWRATERHANDPDLDALIAAVFVHEISHTRQSGALGARVDALVAEQGLNDDEVDDDLVQRVFADRPGCRQAYERERDLLFAAAAAPTVERSRELADEALAAIRERRAAWFQGDDAVYGQLEEIFLSFEGVANWAAVRAIVATGTAPDAAIAQVRRGGRWWSQDEGLALFLVLERLGVPWREQVFGDQPTSVFEMLDRAVRAGESR